MTCSEVMTANPSCCVPSDSVAMAAQIMKREDVGPVLIVSDYYSQNLIGIVTDRDLAVKVIAEGRDPHNTRIDEVMSLNPVTCRASDDAYKALRLMSENQVRRIPVVDSGNRLVGIVTQADLARKVDEEDVGEMVEEISQPYGSAPWEIEHERAARREREPYDGHSGPYYAGSSTANSLAIGVVCLGVGAGMMYLFDPNRGRTRRALARDKALSLYNASGEAVTRTAEDLRNRATGIAAGTKSLFKSEPVSNEKLVERVRSKMGHYVSRPNAIEVHADNGSVRLRGSIFADEIDNLMQCVKGIPGVTSVDNQMDVQQMRSPDMEPPVGEQMDFMKKNWSPATRVMASAVGGGLLLYGIKSRSNIGKATASVGLGLLTRGIANREIADIKGITKLRRLVEEKAPQLH